MTRQVRWGLIGAGFIAWQFAVDLGRTRHGILYGVASRRPERAATLAAAFGGGRAHASVEALLADPAIDAVYVASPNHLHKRHCLLAIGAGKAVLCEKPFALDAAEAREIAAAARGSGVFCMEAMWTRFLPAMTAAKRRVDAGELGAIAMVRAELGFPITPVAGDRFSDPALGGGALLDLGVYGVSIAHWLLGRPDSVSAAASLGASGADAQCAAILHFGDALALVAASHRAELCNTLEIVGARGRIEVAAPFIRATRLHSTRFAARPHQVMVPDGTVKRLLKSTPLWSVARATVRRLAGTDRTARFGFSGIGYRFEADEVARCLAAGATESPVAPLDGSIAVLETLDRIRAGWTT